MSDFVAYKLEHPICTITLDDGDRLRVLREMMGIGRIEPRL